LLEAAGRAQALAVAELGPRALCYANLTASFLSEVLGEVDGNEGNFDDGLRVQEVVNAVEISHRERRWVSLPLAEPDDEVAA
jgi:hypothetical protein